MNPLRILTIILSVTFISAVKAELLCSCGCEKNPCPCFVSGPFYGSSASPFNAAAPCRAPPCPCVPISPPRPLAPSRGCPTTPCVPWPVSPQDYTSGNPSTCSRPAPCAQLPHPCPGIPAPPCSSPPYVPQPPYSFPASNTASSISSSLSAVLEYLTQPPAAFGPSSVNRAKLLSVPLKPQPSGGPCNNCNRPAGLGSPLFADPPQGCCVPSQPFGGYY